ncbi:acylphosphatase [Virgibacillus phasianinus]|nr:acylphosphatase [Virgibacillus phasianinus]
MITDILVSGVVQGVGFRYATKQLAGEFNLKGWVKNNSDGTVQIQVDGDGKKVQKFIKAIKNNPTGSSHVSDIKVTEIETTETFHQFTIK